MKRKTIQVALQHKFNEWIESLPETALRNIARDNTIITGGCITSMLLGEKVNDYDFYFRNKEVAREIAEHYVKLFRDRAKEEKDSDYEEYHEKIRVKDSDDSFVIYIPSAGVASVSKGQYKFFEQDPDPEAVEASRYVQDISDIAQEDAELPPFTPLFLTENAITLSGGIQAITRFHGDSEEIHKNFDYVHCTCYWQSWNGELVLPEAAMESILTKELRYTGSRFPICSVIRSRKFLKRGWSINAGQYLKMCMQISELDLKDPEVLEEQLIGVDTAYFREILGKMKEDSGNVVSASYLSELIDKVF